MKSIKLRFAREELSKSLPHRNRASTDAMVAIVNWADPEKGRSRKVCKDEDEELEAVITFEDDDIAAKEELVARCKKLGIDCFVVR